MERYQNNIQDQFGNAIGGVTVTVRRVSDGGVATLFSDNSGTGKSNPFTNDNDGELFFYAPNDRYDIFLTGAVTDQKDDVLLLDITTTSITLRINTDIVTATPPTTEAVTGVYEIYDLDDTDQLARIGFVGENSLRIQNKMRGGVVDIWAEDSAGVGHRVLSGDPDGATDMYYDGIKRLGTEASGVVALYADGATDTETRYLSFRYSGGTPRGLVGHNGNDVLTLRNQVHGGNISIVGEDAGGVVHNILIGDPDAEFSLYHDGGLRLSSNTTGRVLVHSDGDTDAEQRSVNLCHNDGTVRGSYGYLTDGVLTLRNLIHGNGFLITAEDAGGTARTILTADPDSTTILRADTNLELEVAAGENALVATANSDVALFFDNIETFKTRTNATGMLCGAQVLHADTNFYDVGLAKCPINEISANEDLDNNNQHHFTNKNAGGAVTLELQNTSNIQTGTMWLISNEDTENLTINATTNSCTLRWFDGGGGVPGTGNRTLAQAGVCTVIKIGVAEYFIWGSGLT